MEVTEGYLLGGRLRYAQPRFGYRTGIEPVLLAASVPAQPGQRVLEAGTGAGAGLLCLLARVPDLEAVGIEIDPETAALARRNLAANGFDQGQIETADATQRPLGRFDHVFANPPWHDPRSTPSPVAARRLAKQTDEGGLALWVERLSTAVQSGGTLTLILPAGRIGETEATLRRSGLTSLMQMRLLPKPGCPPKLVIIAASRTPGDGTCVSELVLHEPDGRYTETADAILRDRKPLARAASAR